MVQHELTVFPDGRVDGSVSARNGDYKSHTLHFVLAEGMTGASAKLMVWAPGAEKAVVYDTAKGNGSCTGQDVTVTPVLWSGPGRTRMQLELLNSAGDVVWQSRRFVAVVEDGIPDDAAVPPVIDISDATLTADNALYGAVFYGAAGRAVGKAPDNRVKPRGWEGIPIDSIRTRTGAVYFHRVKDDLFWACTPGDMALTSVPLMLRTRSDVIGQIGITVGGTSYQVSPDATRTITGANLSSAPLALFVSWRGEDGAAHTKIIRVQAAAATAEHGILQISKAAVGTGTANTPEIVSRMGENAGYVEVTTGASGDVVLTCADGHARAVYRGAQYQADLTSKQITIPNVDFHEGFARIDMLDPKTGYRAAYFLMKEPGEEDVEAKTVFRADCAIGFLASDTDIYDYDANGFGPPTAEMAKYDDSAQIIDSAGAYYTEGPWLPAAADAFSTVCASANDTLDAQISTAAEENGLIVVFDDYGGIAAIGDETNPLAEGSLGHGSRWLVFVNGMPVTAPGFLTHIPVNANILLELVYTCADGIDVGFPYAGM